MRYHPRQRPDWLAAANALVIDARPEIAQRADYWDTLIHLFNRGTRPEDAAQKMLDIDKEPA